MQSEGLAVLLWIVFGKSLFKRPNNLDKYVEPFLAKVTR
jgi:hypothetical protein